MLPKPELAYFAIADISGYTSFLAGVELDHAQDIIARTLLPIPGAPKIIMTHAFQDRINGVTHIEMRVAKPSQRTKPSSIKQERSSKKTSPRPLEFCA
jgi:hypothetical protein